jgi:hypothetical protein
MKILLRIVAIVCVLVAALLIGVVIAVGADPDTNLRVGRAIAFVIGGVLLLAAAVWLWRFPGRRPVSGPADPAV